MPNIATSTGAYLDWFHDYSCGFLVFILFLVRGVVRGLCFSGYIFKGFVESPVLELLWTIFPVLVLLLVGFPRLFILYLHEIEDKADISLKVTGHQWYWSYDFSEFPDIEFDRFMLPLEELPPGGFRLLEVSSRVVLPVGASVRSVISSADVLHSWALPALGIKADACPGRMNFVFFTPRASGVFFGQCREICGANHRFMPIGVEVSNFISFASWLKGGLYE